MFETGPYKAGIPSSVCIIIRPLPYTCILRLPILLLQEYEPDAKEATENDQTIEEAAEQRA